MTPLTGITSHVVYGTQSFNLRKVSNEFHWGGKHWLGQSDAGYDLAASEDFLVLPHSELPYTVEEVICKGQVLERREYKKQLIPTDIIVQPVDFYGMYLIVPRSGVGTKFGLGVPHSMGVIDASYTGKLFIAAYSQTGHAIPIQAGEYIAQLIPIPLQPHNFQELPDEDLLNKFQRGDGGFGHTGLK